MMESGATDDEDFDVGLLRIQRISHGCFLNVMTLEPGPGGMRPS